MELMKRARNVSIDMILPSKELLREVLGLDFFPHIIRIELGYLIYTEANKINIYELMNKMKIWAYNQSTHTKGYVIKTVHYGFAVTCSVIGFEETFRRDNKTEFEAVTKACEWILNET